MTERLPELESLPEGLVFDGELVALGDARLVEDQNRAYWRFGQELELARSHRRMFI